ncbi:hypothetical protein FEQ02_03676 [Burkholderia pseudomultivorans]|nr:hypothetical protein [Burkholderia pseudomultivorans]
MAERVEHGIARGVGRHALVLAQRMQRIRIRVARRGAGRIDERDAVEVDVVARGGRVNRGARADQHDMRDAVAGRARGGVQHARIVGFAERDAHRLAARGVENAVEGFHGRLGKEKRPEAAARAGARHPAGEPAARVAHGRPLGASATRRHT